MPRDRKRSVKSPGRGMYIVCEGSRFHSEYAYINGFLQKNGLKIPSLNLVISNKNNPCGLVNDVLKEKKTSEDILWAVFDHDNHSDLDSAIRHAKNEDVKVALSSISFEIWIYLHFRCTTKLFRNSEDVISDINKNFKYVYRKDNNNIFLDIGEKLTTACNNSLSLRKDRELNCAELAKHNRMPYTNFDQLLDAIKNFVSEEKGDVPKGIKYELPY